MADEPMQIQASVLHGPKDIRIETRTIDPPGPSEVQVAIRCTGLCGSDVHYYKHFRNGNIQVLEPLTLGHESAGIVVAAGRDVHDLKAGDAVALEVGVACDACEQCRAGRYNLCPRMDFRSSAKRFPHAQGTLQHRINHPARLCHGLPAGLSFAEGALAEPVSVALHALRRAAFAPGREVLVFGAGPVGLCVAALAKVKEAAKVVIADVDAKRLAFATENGMADFHHAISAASGQDIDEQLKIASEMPERLRKDSLPDDFDIIFECTGSPACLQAAIFTSKPGGKVVMIGMGNPVQTLPISAAALREVDLIGVFRYAGVYREALEIIAENPHLMKMVTRRFTGLDEIHLAFDAASKPNDDEGNMMLKVLVDFLDDD